MTYQYPSKVLITGGHEVGGVGSFAEALRIGFTDLGIPVEIVSPSQLFTRWSDLRDQSTLKILSTTAVFAAPYARRAICMAHGVPRVGAQGWTKVIPIIGSYKLANYCPGTQLVSVSNYTASTLNAIFNVRTDAVVYNAVKPLYLELCAQAETERNYITYVGRLLEAKNLHRMVPSIRNLMDENPSLRMCIIGAGPYRTELETIIGDDKRFEFIGTPDDKTVREWLRHTKVFVSGNEVEGFGISYLEAMTQGCVVAMPASGGGLEIALENVGNSVQLMPLSWDRKEVLAVLRRALTVKQVPISTAQFTAAAAVRSLLEVDARFSMNGRILRNAGSSTTSPVAAGGR